MCALLFSCSNTKNEDSLETVIRNYFAYITEGDEESADQLFVEPSSENQASLDCFQSITVTKIDVQENENDRIFASVDFDVEHKEGMDSPFNEGSNHTTIELKKINEDWKIVSLGNA